MRPFFLKALIFFIALFPEGASAASCGRNPFGEDSGYEVPWPSCEDARRPGPARKALARFAEREEDARRLCRRYLRYPPWAKGSPSYRRCLLKAGH